MPGEDAANRTCENKIVEFRICDDADTSDRTDEADDYKKVGYRICDYADADDRTDEAEDDKKVAFCICHDADAGVITDEAEDDKKVGFRICDGAPSEREISDTIAKLQTLLDKLPEEECLIQNDGTYIAQDIPREHALKLIKDLRQDLESTEKDTIPYTYRSVTFITRLKRFLYFQGRAKNLDKESERGHNLRWLLPQIIQFLEEDFYVDIRHLFYSNRTRIKTDSKLDYTIHLLCSMVGGPRESLHIISSEKGVVIGDLVLQIGGKEINCAPDQLRIPASTEKKKVECIKSNAKFVLLIEKKTVLDMLEQIKFHETYNCILLTGCGMPDLATRFLLREIRCKLKKPVLGLFDCNPYGIHILTVYMFGSKNMAGRNLRLAVPNIKWLGLFPSDLEKYNIPKLCRQILSKDDISKLKTFLEKGDLVAFVRSNASWEKELSFSFELDLGAEFSKKSLFMTSSNSGHFHHFMIVVSCWWWIMLPDHSSVN